MTVVIAGSRDGRLSLAQWNFLDETVLPLADVTVVVGSDRGIDHDAAVWADAHDLPVRLVPANWHYYGKPAGPLRNARMASAFIAPDLVILFPGGTGTESMYQAARQAGVRIIDRRTPAPAAPETGGGA